MKRILVAILFFPVLFSMSRVASASFLRINEYDKQEHAIGAFQATLLIERIFKADDRSDRYSVLMSSTIVGGAMLIKESLLDSTFDSMDLAVGVFGSAAASAFFLLVPQEDYELETEAGWILYSPLSWVDSIFSQGIQSRLSQL